MLDVRYSMVIAWSDEDDAFLVTLPEFPDVLQPCTHGATDEEAARHGHQVLELLIDTYQSQGKPLPRPARAKSEA